MEKWFIRYCVKIEMDESIDHPLEFGIVCAENLSKAAEKLEDFYGPDLLEILQLKYLEEGIIILPRTVLHEIEEALDEA
jgi:hypothetical protein